MMGINYLVDTQKPKRQAITTDMMPFVVHISFKWTIHAANRWLQEFGDYQSEAFKAMEIVESIHARRLNRLETLWQGCTCKPNSVMACEWCSTPKPIRDLYLSERMK